MPKIPEIRQQGTGIKRTWQWNFGDGTWRDMNQDLSRGTVKTYRESAKRGNTFQRWWRDVTTGVPGIAGYEPRMEVASETPGEIVDFDALVEKTDILPARFSNMSMPYMLMLSALWADVTGYNPEFGDYEPGGSWNFDEFGGGVVPKAFLDEQLGEITDDLSDMYGWEDVSRARGYDIDFTQQDVVGGADNPVAQFIRQSQNDVRAGKTYTAWDSRADVKEPIYGPTYKDSEGAPAVETGDITESGRKIVASSKNRDIAVSWAAQINGAIVEESGGNFHITVPPGQGGWGTRTAGQEWLDAAAGDYADKYEVISGPEGQFFIREKAVAAPTPGAWDTEADAKRWLQSTSEQIADPDDPGKLVPKENYEVVPFKGKWVIREKAAVVGRATVPEARSAVVLAGGNPDHYEYPVGPDGLVQTVYTGKPEGYASVGAARFAVRVALYPKGEDLSEYEFPMGNDGRVHVVYKGKAAPGTWDTESDAKEWLKESGDAADFEAVPGPAGKWIIREKQPELRYSTGDTVDAAGNIIPGIPGDMFQPTITEDPTGRQIALDAQGNLQDFGYGMAGDITQEELAGYQVPYRSLDMIVAKAIEQGNWQLARGVQAFMDRPSERDLLDYAAQYAEAPADLAVLSAIARGEQMVQPAVPFPEGMGTAMGQATRIGPPGAEYTSAYKQFKDAMDMGFDPSLPENAEALRELFDPKNDPVYQATQELANKYETQIGTLRDQIFEANKTASERIETSQTNTLNLMTGLFEGTLESFKDVMKESTSMKDAEINRLLAEAEDRRKKDADAAAAKVEADAAAAAAPTAATAATSTGELPQMEEYKDFPSTLVDEETGEPTEAASFRFGDVQGISREDMTGPGGYIDQLKARDDGGAAYELAVNQFQDQGGLENAGAYFNSVQSFEDALNYHLMSPVRDTGRGGHIVSPYRTGTSGQPLGPIDFGPQTDSPLDWTPDEKTFGWQGLVGEPLAEGGVVQGPTMALLGEEEPEFIVPLSKVDAFKRGRLPLGQPRQTQMSGTVAKFEDSIPRFANGGLVTGPRFGGVTARGLEQYGENGAYVTPETRTELELGAGGQYGADGISRAPRIASSDFESLLTRYAEPESQRFLSGADMDPGTRAVQLGNIPEYELRQRLGASEFAGTNPARHPIGIQQLMAGRPIARPRSLMTAANMPIPSGQALRNMLPSELEYYQKMGRMAGIPQAELEREMRSAMPGGTRRTPFRMGARRVRQA
mgnify:CR=1 FL=1